MDTLENRLRARLLLGQRVEGDRLVLADEVLRAALAGTRPLTADERAALSASPLTLRRLRQLSLDVRAAGSGRWRGSRGLLRAAETPDTQMALATDDGYWRLHFVQDAGGWRVILQLAADAPFASALLAGGTTLQVLDGGGALLLTGRLDADGECESAWRGADTPLRQLQRHGGIFSVGPA